VLHQELPHVAPVSAAHPRFSRMALSAIAYYAAGWLMRWRYPHYRHHKDFSPFRELFYWLRSGWRKIIYQQLEKPVVCRIGAQDVQQYFLVPLQVFNDSQILHHSPYADIREFISEVLDSFARYAAPEHHLVIKHHPMDRGHKNYRLLIAELAANAGIRARVHYIHDAHLPSLLKSCAGVVTINSTVGLSALHHGKSVMAMGRAFYDLAGLTSQNGLNDFWCNPAPVDALLYKKLRSFLIRNTQLNGAFYGQAHWMRSAEKYARQNVHRQLELHHPQRRSI
jgi:capsular polysaccharide export protein